MFYQSKQSIALESLALKTINTVLPLTQKKYKTFIIKKFLMVTTFVRATPFVGLRDYNNTVCNYS